MSPFSLPFSVRESLRLNLHEPANYILARPGKGFRSRLVQLGCSLAIGSANLSEEEKRRCLIASSVIEKIHAGSLVVDDIQDESLVRRNAPTLHLKYGVPRALNTGNWLYFSPLTSLKDLCLSPENELQLHRDCLETLSTAHCGQALDIGTRIDEIPQADVPQICFSSLEWKTGELVGLSLRLGAYAAEAPREVRDSLHECGKELGISLQILDDLGNLFMSPQHSMVAKRHEDLRLRRPSWIWSYVASTFSPGEYQEWIEAVTALPDETMLRALIDSHNLSLKANFHASSHLKSAASKLEQKFPECREAHEEVCSFIQQLEIAYE